MNPKSHKVFKEGIAEEVGVHPSVVDDFVFFYYAKLRKTLSDLHFPRVLVDGLGTFYLRKGKLENSIKRHKSILGNLKKRTYKGYAQSENIQAKIEQMSKALEQMENDILKKKEFKKNKNGI